MARRATKIKEMRLLDPGLILIDNGDAIDSHHGNAYTDYSAHVIFSIMAYLGYDVVNIGNQEITWGKSMLGQAAEKYGLTFVSTNLAMTDAPWKKDYVILERNGLRVAVLGVVLAGDYLKKQEGVSMIPWREAVEKTLPKVRDKADLVILLAQGGDDLLIQTKDLKGVDLILSDPSGLAKEETRISYCSPHGVDIGLFDIVDVNGKVKITNRRQFPLDETLADDPEVDKMRRAAINQNFQGKEPTRKDKMELEHERVKDMSPEEYLKQLEQGQ